MSSESQVVSPEKKKKENSSRNIQSISLEISRASFQDLEERRYCHISKVGEEIWRIFDDV